MDSEIKNILLTIEAIDKILLLPEEDIIFHTTVSVPGEPEEGEGGHMARPNIVQLTPELKGYFNSCLKEIVAGDAISKSFAQFRIDQLAALEAE